MSFITELKAQKPLVLILAEPGLELSTLTINLFKENSLETELIVLNQDFEKKAIDFISQERTVYKIVVLYGFTELNQNFLDLIFNFIDQINDKQLEKAGITLLSSVSTSVKIIESLDLKYENFLKQQELFLTAFLNKYSEGLFFIAQDPLLNKQTIGYPLLLFLTAVKNGRILDFQMKNFFQDEKSFFKLIEANLIKPHQSGKFLFKGKLLSSSDLAKKITYLYEQYFQKKLQVLKIFTEEKTAGVLKEFSLVKNTKVEIEGLIDQKIGLISSLDLEKQQAQLSTESLNRLITASKRAQIKPTSSPQKSTKNNFSGSILNFFRNAQKKSLTVPKQALYTEELDKKIENIFSAHRSLQKQVRHQENLQSSKEIIHKTKKRRWLFWLGASIFIFGLALITLILLFQVSQKALQKQLFKVVQGESYSIEKIDKSIFFGVFKLQYQQYQHFLLEESLTHAADIFRLKDSLQQLKENEVEHQRTSLELYKKIIEGGSELGPFYEKNKLSLEKKIEALKKYNGYLTDLNLDLYSGEELQVWSSEKERIRVELKNSLQNQHFFEELQDILLNQGRVNFLVVIQDSDNLRHSGGALTSLILLSFEKGGLVDKQTFVADDLNDRVYGVRQAPEEIKNLFQEDYFSLNRANWGPDFMKMGEDFNWFIEQALGQRVDLIVALNSMSIKAPISEGDLDWLLSLSESDFLNLTSSFQESLSRRETMLFAKKPALQEIIEFNSWGGRKIEALCPTEFNQASCFVDSFLQLETSLSSSKTVPLIARRINHDIGITPSFIRHRRKIVFEESSLNKAFLEGNYSGYLKFYLNPAATLERVELNGQRLNEDSYELVGAASYQELRLKVQVSGQNSTELIIVYTIPHQSNEAFSYVFFDQKQAGISAKTTNYQIVFDDVLIPELVAPVANYQNKTLKFVNNNDDHFLFAVSFSRGDKPQSSF